MHGPIHEGGDDDDAIAKKHQTFRLRIAQYK
jgi:hypothetical protein